MNILHIVMSIERIERIGYGSQFNNLFIIDNKIIKESKTRYGDFKIEKEILFYKYILENNIQISIPKIHEINKNNYVMEYLKDYIPLYKYFLTINNIEKNKIMNKIYSELNMLHKLTEKKITKEKYKSLLNIETYTKLVSRFKEIEEILKKYTFIKKVNGYKIRTFNEIIDSLQNKINIYINSLDNYSISVIHGDCQFNNILYNVSTDRFVFIDPRGYFGDEELFGIPEYDLAKVKFALSGYDIFDNMEINELNIDGDNLILPNIFIIDDNNLFKKDDIVSILTISIWLGNAHCFKNNIPKTVFSFYYALYLASLYL
jgi:hypothetical protein